MTTEQLQRFIARLSFRQLDDDLGECWMWTGGLLHGYGRISLDGVRLLAHRAAYEHFVGTIPLGLEIDHLCRQPSCVNPRHLEAVTAKENVRRGLASSLLVTAHRDPSFALRVAASHATPEYLEKQRVAGRRRVYSQKHLDRLDASSRMTGKTHSAETRVKMAEARRRYWARKREVA